MPQTFFKTEELTTTTMQLKSIISFQSDNHPVLTSKETEAWRHSSTFHLFPPEYPTKAKDSEHVP